MKTVLTTALAAAIFAAIPAFAGPPSRETYPDIDSIPAPLLSGLRHGHTYQEQYVSGLLDIIRNNARSGDALDKEDADRIAKKALHQRRREQYLTLLRYDLDFDGTITETEVRRIMLDEKSSRQTEESCADEAGKFVKRYDTDQNGEISLAEMSTPAGLGRARKDETAKKITELVALDPNQDGKLTEAELEGMSRKAFATIDANGDGALSPEETREARDYNREY